MRKNKVTIEEKSTDGLTIIYSDSLTQKRVEGHGRIIERQESLPTKNQWAYTMFLVELENDYGDKFEVRRPILEVGKPNECFPNDEDYSKYGEADRNESLASDIVKKVLKKRGRPKKKVL